MMLDGSWGAGVSIEQISGGQYTSTRMNEGIVGQEHRYQERNYHDEERGGKRGTVVVSSPHVTKAENLGSKIRAFRRRT